LSSEKYSQAGTLEGEFRLQNFLTVKTCRGISVPRKSVLLNLWRGEFMTHFTKIFGDKNGSLGFNFIIAPTTWDRKQTL
jgi:hypothetical protein